MLVYFSEFLQNPMFSINDKYFTEIILYRSKLVTENIKEIGRLLTAQNRPPESEKPDQAFGNGSSAWISRKIWMFMMCPDRWGVVEEI